MTSPTPEPTPGPAPDHAPKASVRRWPTSSFAVVMASGITSTALHHNGATTLSWIPLGFGLVAFVVVAGVLLVQLTQLARLPRSAPSGPAGTGAAFGTLTLVAALGVLSTRLEVADLSWLAIPLAVAAVLAWLVLVYAVPAGVMLRQGDPAPTASLDGSWLLWVVATQSVSLAVSSVDLGLDEAGPAIALSLWGIGVVLYLLLTGLVLWRLMSRPSTADSLTPSYWILTGATAISVLAGARLLADASTLPPGDPVNRMEPFVLGTAYVLWSFGTWWIPLLLVFGVWRYAVQHRPVRYEVGLWSIVFPIGMYATATRELGQATGLGLLLNLGQAAAVVAVVCWVLVLAAMARSAATSRIVA